MKAMSTPARLLATLGIALSLSAPLIAGTEEPAAVAPAPAASRFHLLTKLEVSDKYLTPRGMIVQNEGVTIQPLVLGMIDLYDNPGAFLSDITLVGGVWCDYATEGIPEGLGPDSSETNFIEIDPIFGVSLGLGKNFKLDVTYTAFAMQILDIGTSHHLETKLSYDDTDLLGAFALHPYLLFWKELDGKATAAANFGVDESYYFEVGIAPGVKLGSVKLEAPIRVVLPASDFYGETFASSSTVGLYEVGLKATIPISMPEGYGFWNAYIGVRYMDFVDDNLKQLANGGGFGPVTDDTAQVYAGISVFF